MWFKLTGFSGFFPCFLEKLNWVTISDSLSVFTGWNYKSDARSKSSGMQLSYLSKMIKTRYSWENYGYDTASVYWFILLYLVLNFGIPKKYSYFISISIFHSNRSCLVELKCFQEITTLLNMMLLLLLPHGIDFTNHHSLMYALFILLQNNPQLPSHVMQLALITAHLIRFIYGHACC